MLRNVSEIDEALLSCMREMHSDHTVTMTRKYRTKSYKECFTGESTDFCLH